MAVTVAQLAQALRIGSPDVDQTAVLTRHLGVASAVVLRLAPPMVPAAITDEATIRVAGYLYDAPPLPESDVGAALLSRVGARGLMAPWEVHRAGAVGGVGGALPVSAGGGGVDTAAVNSLIDRAVAVLRTVPTGGLDGQVLTAGDAGVFAWEALPQQGSGGGVTLPVFDGGDIGEVLTVDSASALGWRPASISDSNFRVLLGNQDDYIDARAESVLDNEIPSNRRVPALGTAGQLLSVNNASNGLVWSTVATGGGGGGSSELSSLVALPTLGTSGDIVNVEGELYEVVPVGTDRNEYIVNIGGQSTSSDPGSRHGPSGQGWLGDSVFEFKVTTGGPSNPFRVNLSRSVLGLTPPETLWIRVHIELFQHGRPHDYFGTFKLARWRVGATYPLDTGTTYRYAQSGDSVGTRIPNVVGASTVEVKFYQNSTLSTAQPVLAADRWRRYDHDVPWWARSGDDVSIPDANLGLPAWVYDADSPVPLGKLPVIAGTSLIEHSFPGLTATRSDRDVRPSASTTINPLFDLDDANKQHGEFHASLQLVIDPVSDVNMGFEPGKANQTLGDRRRVDTAIAFASAVRAEEDFIFAASADLNGLEVISRTVYSGSTIAGQYHLLLVHNGNNQLGIYHHWEGAAGATGFTISAELRLSWTPSDAPTVPVGPSTTRLIGAGLRPPAGLTVDGWQRDPAMVSNWSTRNSHQWFARDTESDLVRNFYNAMKHNLDYMVLEINQSNEVFIFRFGKQSKSLPLSITELWSSAGQVGTIGINIPSTGQVSVYQGRFIGSGVLSVREDLRSLFGVTL